MCLGSLRASSGLQEPAPFPSGASSVLPIPGIPQEKRGEQDPAHLRAAFVRLLQLYPARNPLSPCLLPPARALLTGLRPCPLVVTQHRACAQQVITESQMAGFKGTLPRAVLSPSPAHSAEAGMASFWCLGYRIKGFWGSLHPEVVTACSRTVAHMGLRASSEL